MHKGQVATEFFIYAGVFLIVVIIAFSATAFIQTQEIQSRESVLAYETGAGFADAINLAVRSGRGFHTNLTFRTRLEGRPYQVLIDPRNGRIIFDWQGTYGQISSLYPIATYDYRYEEVNVPAGTVGCISDVDRTLVSDRCKNKLVLFNNGSTLFIEQPR